MTRSLSVLLSSPQELQTLARAATKGTVGRCWVSRALSGREQALQSFVASCGVGFGWRSNPAAAGGIETRSVAATFGMFLEFDVVVAGQGQQALRCGEGRMTMTTKRSNDHSARADRQAFPLGSNHFSKICGTAPAPASMAPSGFVRVSLRI